MRCENDRKEKKKAKFLHVTHGHASTHKAGKRNCKERKRKITRQPDECKNDKRKYIGINILR